MKLAAVVLVVLFGIALASYEKENGVYELTADNFDAWISEQDYALVKFYAPWCGHCKSLAPEYELAAKELEGKVGFAKIDGTEHDQLAQSFDVRGFPTLFWFQKGIEGALPYGGGRVKDTIITWIERQMLTELPAINSQEELDEAIKNAPSNIHAIVVQYGPETDPVLLEAAKSVEFVLFYRSTTLLGDAKDGDLVMYRHHGEPVTTQISSPSDLSTFLDTHAYPDVIEFSPQSLQRLRSKDLLVIAADAYADGKKESLIKTLEEAAAGRTNFGWMYADSALLSRGIEAAGASGKVYPTAVAIDFKFGRQLAFDEDLPFNSETLAKWVEGVLTGESQPFKKSEPIPESNDGPVFTLVHKNFAENVGVGKPAFVEYYAPWCGHCKELAPIWEELGSSVDKSKVLIAKIDATANYFDADVTGFPTLIWHNTDGTVEVFDGLRNLEELKAFVDARIGGSTGGSHVHDEF
jgi:protein disulfide-isomerase A1